MELPSCRDIGGEDRLSGGFCPAEYFVPAYAIQEWTDWNGETHQTRLNNPKPDDLLPRTYTHHRRDEQTGEGRDVETKSIIVTPPTFYPFGFVAGCVWGDDSSWKIQYLDLSEVERGIIRRDARFGYIELPVNVTLRDAIDMYDYL